MRDCAHSMIYKEVSLVKDWLSGKDKKGLQRVAGVRTVKQVHGAFEPQSSASKQANTDAGTLKKLPCEF